MTETLVLAQLWQVTLVAVTVLVVARFCGNRPHVVSALWLVVLVKAVTPPVWSSPIGLFSLWPAADVRSTTNSDVSPPVDAESPRSPTLHVEDVDAIDPELAANVLLGHLPGTEPVEEPAPREAIEPLVRSEPVPPVASRDPSPTATLPRPFEWPRVTTLLLAAWLAGTTVLVIRAIHGWRRVVVAIRDRVEPSDALSDLFESTRRTLGVRNRVRLVVTRRGLGPAVVGFVRPTVVLPEAVVAGRSPGDLEPIVVHELMHVRRGDTWIGALQLVAGIVWWFHPLVVWVNRLLTRDVERCCDAESIAALGRSPADYALSLVDVLERKRRGEIRSLPALPGVRPMDVTANRLERIMRTKTPPSSRVRWASRLLLLSLAALVLPGAAGLDEREPAAPEPTVATDPPADSPDSALGPVPVGLDFAFPVESASENVFSFYIGNHEVRVFDPSELEETVEADHAPPAEEPQIVANPEPGSDEMVVRNFAGLRFDFDPTSISVESPRSEPASDPATKIDELAGRPLAKFHVRVGGDEIAFGTCKRARFTATLDEGEPGRTELEDVQLRVAEHGRATSQLRAERLKIVNAPERRLSISATGLQYSSKTAHAKSERALLLVEPRTEPRATTFGGAVLLGDVHIGVRRGQGWFTARAERVDFDGEGRAELARPGLPYLFDRTIENGEVVTRSRWPVPFTLREPVPAEPDPRPPVADGSSLPPVSDPPPTPSANDPIPDTPPSAVPVEPLVSPRPGLPSDVAPEPNGPRGLPATVDPRTPNAPVSRTPEPVPETIGGPVDPVGPPADLRPSPLDPNVEATRPRRSRNVVVDALLGTAPPPKPPTVERVLDRWQETRRVRAPIDVAFVRHRYLNDVREAASSSGRFRFDHFVEGSDEQFVSHYELLGPVRNGVRQGVRQGYRSVPEAVVQIVLSKRALKITRPGPDFFGELSEEQAAVLQSLQMLQVGYLSGLVRENFEWQLVVDDSQWQIHGKPLGKPFAEHVGEVTVMIDPVEERPIATRVMLVDEAETVHVFSNGTTSNGRTFPRGVPGVDPARPRP